MQSKSPHLSLHALEAEAFLSFLVTRGLLSLDQRHVLEKEAALQGSTWQEVLLHLGFLTERALQEAQAAFTGYASFAAQDYIIDPELVSRVPAAFAKTHRLFPVCFLGEDILVATLSPDRIMALEELSRYLPPHRHLIPLVASLSDMEESLSAYYQGPVTLTDVFDAVERGQAQGTSPAVRLVNAIIADAIKRRASDIHFEPQGTFVRLRYRIDDVLHVTKTFHSQSWSSICVRLKVMSKMDIAESRRPQDGRFELKFQGRTLDFRVATHPTVDGENIVVRILDRADTVHDLDHLGFSPVLKAQLENLCDGVGGLIIVTGPTGSGKSTTLYALLNQLNDPSVNIMTLEDPVEYRLPLVRQTEVREKIGFGFAEGVRSVLRQDPDILLVGEIRDALTAQMAMRATMTGHQVLGTLHTTDVFGAIPRLMDFGITQTLLAENVRAILAQRLLRKLCMHCRIQDKKTNSFEAVGCPACHGTGYHGRFAIGELWILTSEDRQHLLHGIALDEWRVLLEKEPHFTPLRQEANRVVEEGLTSRQEVRRVLGGV